MKDTKKDWSKWIYWFLLGIALIIVYKGLDNYDSVMNGIKGLMNVLSPFIVGIFISYLLFYTYLLQINIKWPLSLNTYISKSTSIHNDL